MPQSKIAQPRDKLAGLGDIASWDVAYEYHAHLDPNVDVKAPRNAARF